MRSMYVIQYPFFRYIKESILKNVISGVRCSGQYSVFCWRLAALWGERDNSAAAAVRASQVRENCCTGNFLSKSIKKSNQIRKDLRKSKFSDCGPCAKEGEECRIASGLCSDHITDSNVDCSLKTAEGKPCCVFR